MELHEYWKQIEAPVKNLNSDIMNSVNQASGKHPIRRIRKSLILNSYWGIVITIGIMAVVFIVPYLLVQVFLSIYSLFSIWGLWHNYKRIQALKQAEKFQGRGMLQELEKQYVLINTQLRKFENLSLLSFPLLIAGSFMLGGAVGSGEHVLEIMSRPLFQWLLVFVLLTMTPVSFYLGKWMNKKAFGEHLDNLNSMILELKAENY